MNRPNQTPDNAWQIQTLADSARRLAERGDLQEAEKIFLKILEAAPYHVRSLSFLASQSMARGDLDAGEGYLDRALRVAPDRAILHQNMGLLQKQRGNLEAALPWLDRAIELKPEHRFASLHKGAILQELGRHEEAAAAYWHAWRYFPGPEQTANDALTLPAVRDLLLGAAESLRAAQSKIIETHLAPVQERYGQDALARVRDAADVYVGRRPAAHQHALQRPAFIYMPGVAAQAFFDRADFDWVPELESHTREIRDEVAAALTSGEGLTPYVQVPPNTDPQQWKELNGSMAWSSLQFSKGGTRIEANRARCPKTAAVLDALPSPEIPGHAPEALCSILKPGAYIPPHFGLANYKLVAHLPLVVPPDCAIRVGNETRSWTEGECLIFDDSFQHEAWNRSSQDRAVLIVEIWNPAVTQAEREGITALVAGTAEFKHKYAGAA